jgi:hypothetical protein
LQARHLTAEEQAGGEVLPVAVVDIAGQKQEIHFSSSASKTRFSNAARVAPRNAATGAPS